MLNTELLLKPLTTLWQFFMTDKPVVTGKVKLQPTIKGQRWEDYLYTVRLPENHPNRMPGQDTRQVHRYFDYEGGNVAETYVGMFFLIPEFEGEAKFYAAGHGTRIYDGRVPNDVRQAILVHDGQEIARRVEIKAGEPSGPDAAGQRPHGLRLN